MIFVYTPTGIDQVNNADIPGLVEGLAEDYKDCIYFEAELCTPEEERPRRQCKVPLRITSPDIDICVLEAYHDGPHKTTGFWHTISYGPGHI